MNHRQYQQETTIISQLFHIDQTIEQLMDLKQQKIRELALVVKRNVEIDHEFSHLEKEVSLEEFEQFLAEHLPGRGLLPDPSSHQH